MKRVTPNRSRYLQSFICLMLFTVGSSLLGKESEVEFAFGAIADCQYCAVQGTEVRKYSLSKEKLTKCVDYFNTMDLAYVIHLGDFIDREFKNFDVLNPILNQLNMPVYHVLGNHDYSVSDEQKKDVPGKLGLTSKYYDFKVQGWRYVVLDGNDISFHAYPRNSKKYQDANEYYSKNNIQSPKWNGAIGPKQRSWLRSVLEKATNDSEQVIVFCHFPIFPESNHSLWNAEEILNLLEAYPCVKAYINGHNHKGDYGMKNGVHYVTLKGMVETNKTAYAVIRTKNDRIQITGYGREKSRTLLIRK